MFFDVQCATLYTTVYGQRRIRVMNLSLPCTSMLSSLFRSADLDTQFTCFLKQGTFLCFICTLLPYFIFEHNKGAQVVCLISEVCTVLAFTFLIQFLKYKTQQCIQLVTFFLFAIIFLERDCHMLHLEFFFLKVEKVDDLLFVMHSCWWSPHRPSSSGPGANHKPLH